LNFLWRISRHDELNGWGGEKSDGRWHTAAKGKRIVYLTEHPAVSLVEVLANLRGNPRLFPDTYRLMKIETPPDLPRLAVDPITLPQGWRNDLALTQELGDAWLAARTAALVAVPSAPSPESTNYLLNPRHPDARQLTILWTRWVEYDKRLFHLHES
jgi:RES domain-containing protein